MSLSKEFVISVDSIALVNCFIVIVGLFFGCFVVVVVKVIDHSPPL